MRVHWVRCRGSRFSVRLERPKKPVPTVMVGARFVSSPADAGAAGRVDRRRAGRRPPRRRRGSCAGRASGSPPSGRRRRCAGARGPRRCRARRPAPARAPAAGTASRARAAPPARSASNGATSTRVPRRDADPGRLRERGRVLAGQRRLDPPAGIQRGAGAPRLLLVEHVRPVPPELAREARPRPAPRRSPRTRSCTGWSCRTPWSRRGRRPPGPGRRVASTSAGTLPGPTPSDGLPER